MRVTIVAEHGLSWFVSFRNRSAKLCLENLLQRTSQRKTRSSLLCSEPSEVGATCIALRINRSCLRIVSALLLTYARPAIAGKVCASYPLLEETGAIEQIFPKKESAVVAKLCAVRVVRPSRLLAVQALES